MGRTPNNFSKRSKLAWKAGSLEDSEVYKRNESMQACYERSATIKEKHLDVRRAKIAGSEPYPVGGNARRSHFTRSQRARSHMRQNAREHHEHQALGAFASWVTHTSIMSIGSPCNAALASITSISCPKLSHST